MTVRSTRLWAPTAVGAANVTLYTCPSGVTALLKHLTVVNNTASGGWVRLRLNGTSQDQNIHDGTVGSTTGTHYVGLFIVLEPGDVLRAIASATGFIVTGYGSELAGVAP